MSVNKIRTAVVGTLLGGAVALALAAPATANAGPRHFMMKEPGVSAPASTTTTPSASTFTTGR